MDFSNRHPMQPVLAPPSQAVRVRASGIAALDGVLQRTLHRALALLEQRGLR